MKKKLVYVMDAQCGWCYGNSKNMLSIYQEFSDTYDFEFLNGGMWVGENAPQSGGRISEYIGSQIPRLESHTGMKISEAFISLIRDSDYVLSSLEPSAAIVLMKEQTKQAFLIAKEVQSALFVEAKRLDELSTYLPILEKFDIDASLFENQWMSEENLKQTNEEFNKVRSMVNAFPCLLIEENNQLSVLASGYFELEAMRERLKIIS